MLDTFVRFPLIALMPAAFFGLMYFVGKQRFVLLVAKIWAVYFLYELSIKLKLICSGECNIRVDLLLIYPVLAILSAIAIVAIYRIKPNEQ